MDKIREEVNQVVVEIAIEAVREGKVESLSSTTFNIIDVVKILFCF